MLFDTAKGKLGGRGLFSQELHDRNTRASRILRSNYTLDQSVSIKLLYGYNLLIYGFADLPSRI